VNPRRATAKPFAAVVAVLIALVASACSSGSPGSTATPDGETSAAGGDEARWLFTLTAESATFGDGELRLTGLADQMIVFADAPQREVRQLPFDSLPGLWEHSGFTDVPPNAVIAGEGDANGTQPIMRVLELTGTPRLENGELVFDASVEASDDAAGDDELPALSNVVLTIDDTTTNAYCTVTPDVVAAWPGFTVRWIQANNLDCTTAQDVAIKLGQSVAARAEPYYTFSVDGSSFNCSIGRPLISTYYYDYVDVCTPGGGPSAVVGVRFRASS
jgi:hypothetical protein